jgi:hypothetical protein
MRYCYCPRAIELLALRAEAEASGDLDSLIIIDAELAAAGVIVANDRRAAPSS